MKTRLLPQTNLTVSQICLGTANFGVPLSQSDAFLLLDTFIDRGGNFIDTARVYAEWLPGGANASESTIGAWMKQRGNRDKVVLATKGAHPDLKTMHIPRMSRADIQHDIEASLRYLQTDVIDLYWLHRDAVNVPVGEILEMLNEQMQAGKIRYFACSNWTVERLQAAIDYAQAQQIMGFVANQPMWSLAEPNRDAVGDKTVVIMDDDTLAFHRATNFPLIPFSSQGRGFFQRFAAGQVKDRDLSLYDNPINRVRAERIQELSKRHNVNMGAVVLSYLTSQPYPVFPIIGASSLDQLMDSLQYPDLTLSPDELVYLERVELP